jgi:hypothetical protein
MNAVLRAVVKAAAHEHGIEIVGFRDGFAGLPSDDSLPLGFDDVSGILVQGGTILGASNKDDPFRVPTADGSSSVDRSDALLATLSRHGIDGLIVIGGDGSLRITDRLGARGVAVVAVPKTIDNDVTGTDITLGFDSARAIATEAVDRLHTTAASHHRLMVLDVMNGEAYLVHKGKVEVRKLVDGEERALKILRQGDLLGELALFRAAPHSATAVAAERVTLLVISADRLEQMIRAHPRLAMALIRQLARMAAGEDGSAP